MPPLLQTWVLPAALLAIVNISTTWYNVVSEEVPEPYLDEFFHIPQAQKYCKSDYSWDSKITTPPGLYLVAKLFQPLIGCETASLRVLNIAALCLICPLNYSILRLLRTSIVPKPGNSGGVKSKIETSDINDSSIILDANTALNITLFPPLFFFSALFYTDVMSTLVVLLSYSALLKTTATPRSIFIDFNAVSVGVLALLFRQTNIFWVAVFPASLSVINALKATASPSTTLEAKAPRDIFQRSWSEGFIHDCSVQDAGLQDYVLLLLSVALAAPRKPLILLRVTLPYLILLALFAAFVVWNGSVVLGDKSAHTATTHLPQMLYIWPYIVFFSAPLLAGPLLQTVFSLAPKQLQNFYKRWFFSSSVSKIPDVLISSLFMVGAFSAVHFNTIIHPYTLADNRHYVFYVFRILRGHPAIKYLAVPLYFVCAWLAIHALGTPSNGEDALTKKRDNACPTSDETGRPPCQISFITIWLVTTALSVVTAPLVEPRYFIIPWIIWRLHVQPLPASLSTRGRSMRTVYDMRLGFESLWLLAINGAVTYVFINWGFTWPSEPGKVQRFLW